jgi:hypothetical protein
MTQHTPWHIESVSINAFLSRVFLVGADGGEMASICARDDVLKSIVKCVNAHDALIEALKIAQCEIEQGGTVDRELVMQRIDAALKLARGEA